MTRFLRYLLVVGAAVSGIFLFFMASLSGQAVVFEKYYIWLFGLNSLVAVALLSLIVLLLSRLYRRYKKKEFGTRLLAKLILLFATLAILPGALIYAVSVQFVSRSIESGFDARVEKAINAGLNLGRSALDNSLAELITRAHRAAQELADLSESKRVVHLSRLFDPSQQLDAAIINSKGIIVSSSTSGQIDSVLPDMPTQAMLRAARQGREYSGYEGGSEVVPDNDAENDEKNEGKNTVIRLRVIVLIPNSQDRLSLRDETQFLQLIEPIPEAIRINTDTLVAANGKYQELAASRASLRKIYIATLTLTLLLAIFASIVSAFLLAADLIKPILLLAEGTKAVTEGNLSPRPIIASTDELGSLTQSFNTMTRQLFDARATVERNRSELQNAKAYLESVLANMSAGVMVLDQHFQLVTCNESVERILQLSMENYINKPLAEIHGLATFAQAIATAFSEQNAQSAAGGNADQHWQQQIELTRELTAEQSSEAELNSIGQDFGEIGKGKTQTITLLARGSHLPVSSGTGSVVVFDDITNIISAQRSIAWGEVGRRLAHEIKNPLTPIQLSAERLQMKLLDKLSEADAAILSKSTTTIVNQVNSMKHMVDDFRDYARTPPALLTPLNLNGLIDEVMNLYMGGDNADVIRMKLSPDLPTILGDATQLRQVIHNLLQNAQDSVNEKHGDSSPSRQIDVITEVVHYQNSEGKTERAASLSISDNGVGFSSKILARVFEPYATTKPRGTGLGLAIVKKILEEHGGRIDIKNRVEGIGAKVSILLLKLAP